MNCKLKRFVPVFCAGFLVFSGCAKQQTVKVDPALAPSATVATTSPAPSAAATAVQDPAAPSTAALSAQAQPMEQPSAAAQPSAVATATAATGARGDAAKGLEAIYFDFDSATLGDAARQTLAENYRVLSAAPGTKIRIEGHCDERGSDEYNLALSERRAQAALKYLEALGVPAERLSAIGYGEEKPADPTQNDAAWAKNRRDEFAVAK